MFAATVYLNDAADSSSRVFSSGGTHLPHESRMYKRSVVQQLSDLPT